MYRNLRLARDAPLQMQQNKRQRTET